MSKQITNELIFTVVQKGLDALGESPKRTLWFYLEQEYGFTRKNIPENLTSFQDVLQKFFGLGYTFLDTLFRQYLCQETNENLEGYSTFVECVNALRLKNSINMAQIIETQLASNVEEQFISAEKEC
jgi:hypothetical protein